MKLSDRITRLEDRFRPTQHDPVTAAALDLLDDDELNELGRLFRTHGVEWTAALPQDAQARVLALLDAGKARAVQSTDSATADAAGQVG